ncbi:MAG: hypothetical protein Q7J13_00475 [Brevundimonas sp.]|uniref:hypothetical protein n=1 Tax=Brevundimonas sp. TaxID=1871086 RepID=UPI0027217F94|nr:hypothetical protein [Brevundimonas sp.]MDO9586387.1 hypothetical protein [Brevundimonas sp.]
MRIRMMSAVVAAAAGLMAFPAMAEDGRYGPQLGQMLAEAAGGTCLEALMSPALLDVCNGQIAGMAPALSAMGEIEAMTFVSAEDAPEGRVETWSVKYAGGRTVTWFIGHQLPDGRFNVVGTAG